MPLKLSLEPPVIVVPHSGKHYHWELLEVPWGGRMRPLLVGDTLIFNWHVTPFFNEETNFQLCPY